MIRRVRNNGKDVPPDDGSPWVLDVRTFDIKTTIVTMIRNAPAGLVAVSLRAGGSRDMIPAAERAARQRKARIIWIPIKRDPHD